MIVIFSVLALVVCFYAYVFVNFQKELAGIRRRKLLGAVTIPLQVQPLPENELEQPSQSSQNVYQVESAYLGPLFVVPRKSESVNRIARAARARLVSAMHATAPATIHPKVAASSGAESDHGNVIKITARAAARV
jgi:hypothetical protein